MRKLAVFVEGYTELVFVEKLLEEVAGIHQVRIETRSIRGGSSVGRTSKIIRAAQPDTGQKFYVLIFDCGGDELVKTRVMEEHEGLTKAGYVQILAMRDVRPKFTHADIPRLEATLPKYIKTKLAPVTFILAVMEIEAWFLAEASHFPRVHPNITAKAIKAILGFDPEADDMSLRLWPAKDMEACYAIGGVSYIKGQAQVTINALDCLAIYMDLSTKVAHVTRLVKALDEFLAA